MKTLRERVMERAHDELCPVCAFRGADGECYPPDPPGCAVVRNIDKLIEVVRSIRSDRMDPYVARLREVVCAECENQDETGRCKLRDRADCALDDYFQLLVEIIEDEIGREARPPTRAPRGTVGA